MIKGSTVENVMLLHDYLVRQIEKSTVTVRLKTVANAKTIMQENPDAVIIAEGAPYYIPDVPGIQGKNVYTVPTLKKMASVPMKMFGPEKLASLSERFLPVGKSIVVLGGKAEGVQCAVFMRKRGKKVVLLETGDRLGGSIPEKLLSRISPWFDQMGVETFTGVTYRQITKQGVSVVIGDGTERFFPCDSVLVMEPQVRNDALLKEVRSLCGEVHLIGSALGGENAFLKDAMLDGRRAGCAV